MNHAVAMEYIDRIRQMSLQLEAIGIKCDNTLTEMIEASREVHRLKRESDIKEQADLILEGAMRKLDASFASIRQSAYSGNYGQ